MAGQPHRLIVVVDDDATIRATLVETLGEQPGWTALGARSGLEVLDLLGRHRADAVLLDLDMPGMDGVDLATWLAGDPAGRGVTLIGMTALHRWAGMRRDALAAGCRVILDKPFDLEEVVTTIGDLLERGGARH
jgi:CheY-like chemotaxis protein